MFCAFGSIYAGMFGLQTLQYLLIGGALVTLVLGLRSPSPPEQRPPS